MKTLFEACILLYGEHLEMTSNIISHVETFQGEIGRRILEVTPLMTQSIPPSFHYNGLGFFAALPSAVRERGVPLEWRECMGV